MIDVFISTIDYNNTTLIGNVRRKIRGVVYDRWAWESKGIRLIILRPSPWKATLSAMHPPSTPVPRPVLYHARQDCDAVAFQRERRIIADEKATTDLYVLADDDCLLETAHPCLDKAIEVMNRHPEFGIISWYPLHCDIIPWTPPQEERINLVGGTVFTDDEVMEHVSVGGIRLCRKALMKSYWPPMDEGVPSYDGIHCGTLRKLGWRSGYFKELRQLHMGRHYSLIWNKPDEPDQL